MTAFTIQYEAVNGEHKLQSFEGTRAKLAAHLARFQRPIAAVYEQATPITKAMRAELQTRHDLLKYARDFVTSRD